MNKNQINGRIIKYFKKYFPQQFLKPDDKEFKELVKLVEMDEPGIVEMLLQNDKIKKIEIEIEETNLKFRITSLGPISGKLFWFECIYSKNLISQMPGGNKHKIYNIIMDDIAVSEQTLIKNQGSQHVN